MEDLFAAEQKILEDAEAYAKALREGAELDIEKVDKFVKEYGRLLRQLRRATRISDRATGTLSTHKEDLQGKVNVDALTGIYNRRYLDDNIDRVVKAAARAGNYICVMMMDIDCFKKYNDTYGHGAGDTCLKAVAEAIAGCVSRPNDFVSRYGGEEFAVILQDTDEKGARLMAQRIVDTVKAKNIPHAGNTAADCVTVSIGVTSAVAQHNHKGDSFIKRADKALYQSKENGRNRYTFIGMEA